jgi:hypothetical protein
MQGKLARASRPASAASRAPPIPIIEEPGAGETVAGAIADGLDQDNAPGMELLAAAVILHDCAAIEKSLACIWRVDSDAAVKLITGTASEMNGSQQPGRAEALCRAALALIAKRRPEEGRTPRRGVTGGLVGVHI